MQQSSWGASRCWATNWPLSFYGCRNSLHFSKESTITTCPEAVEYSPLPHTLLSRYCNGFDQRVARQRLRKHGPRRNNIWGCVFYVGRAKPSAGNGPMNSQSNTWHVLSVGSVPKNYKRFQNNREGSPGGLSWEFSSVWAAVKRRLYV
jgi:hypothetical protein